MRFTHLRLDNRIVGTVVTVLKGQRVYYAVTGHNPVDVFTRRDGRGQAAVYLVEQLMNTSKELAHSGWVYTDRKKVRFNLMTAIAGRSDMPSNVRKAAKLWLKTKGKEILAALAAANGGTENAQPNSQGLQGSAQVSS